MAKEYCAIVNIESKEGIQKLRDFLLNNFSNENIWVYCVDAGGAWSAQLGSAQEDQVRQGRVDSLKERFEEELLINNGPHMLFGKTIEEKVDSIITYINSGLCEYINIHDVNEDSWHSIAMSVKIDNGTKQGFLLDDEEDYIKI